MDQTLRAPWLVALLLAATVLLIYSPAVRHDFITLDDPDFVTTNLQVQRGLTWEGVAWAFRPGHGDYWHPVTWLSHMLDVELFGRSAAGPHAINVLFHAVNAVLVFGLLRRLTGATGRSAAVAALFALHPLRVESVAWVAERKDVLSAWFGLLALRAYAEHASGGPRRRSRAYWLALLFFALGLMTKAMLVTLPFVMLLLDYWPMRRVARGTGQESGICAEGRSKPADQVGRVTPCAPSPNSASLGAHGVARPTLTWWQLFREKIPFFILSAAACGMTYWTAQHAVEAVVGLSFGARLQTAALGYVWYLAKTVWPVGLAPMYPHPGQWPPLWIVMAVVGLAGLSWGVVVQARKQPYAVTGWGWYLGTLVPVIGLVQVGMQWVADRFSYLPHLGVLIVLVWGAADLLARWRLPGAARVLLAGLALALCAGRTRDQLSHWRDTESLFTHTLAVTRNNVLAHNLLGGALLAKGQPDRAEAQFREALRLAPRDAFTLANLGDLLAEQGHLADARSCLEAALTADPRLANAHAALGRVLVFGGDWAGGVAHYREALRLKPDQVETLNNLAWTLATCPAAEIRAGDEAVRLAERACELTGFQAAYTLGTLAAAYAEAGRFADAVATAERARELARAAGQTELAERNHRLWELYRTGRAYREETVLPIRRDDVRTPPAD